MRSTANTHKERADENMDTIKEYAVGNKQRTFTAEEITSGDLESGTVLDSAIDDADRSATSDSLMVDHMDVHSAYALKRDMLYVYAERKYLMSKALDSKMGDEFRGNRNYRVAEKMEPQ